MQAVSSSARQLDATNNMLSSLPGYLAGFVQLQRLLLASNHLRALPQHIGDLKQLKVGPDHDPNMRYSPPGLFCAATCDGTCMHCDAQCYAAWQLCATTQCTTLCRALSQPPLISA